MTEQEWLVSTDPQKMLDFLKGKVSNRKLRLLAVACCRRFQHLLFPEARDALDVAEAVAEGTASSDDRRRVRDMAFHVGWVSDPSTRHRRGPAKAAVCDAIARQAWKAASVTVWRTSHIGTLETYASCGEDWASAEKRRGYIVAELLRDIFDNPFHGVTIDPAWTTPDVVTLAGHIYHDRAFEQMPQLAAALEAVGCLCGDIPNHCRGPGPHVRGCWVLDLLLAKN